MKFGSNVEDLAQQGEPHTPLCAVAGIGGGGARLLMCTMAPTTVCSYLFLNGDLIAATEVVAGGSWCGGRLWLCGLGMLPPDRVSAAQWQRKAASTHGAPLSRAA